VLTGLLPTERAVAAEPVPCTSIGGGKYNCEWWRAGNGFSAGAMVVRHENGSGSPLRVVGRLPQGTNWIVCQQQGATVHDSAGNRNHWYAWTESEGVGGWGWASALDARGGTDFGMFGGGVPICGSQADGAPPSIAGLWETTPPPAAGPQPAPNPPAPPAAPPGGPRTGPQPDHTLYRAGQWLTFDSGAGKQACTAGFVLMWNDEPFGVSAAHCSGWDQWGKFRYGGVHRELAGSLERLGGVAVEARGDSLLFEVSPGRYLQAIDLPGASDLPVTDMAGPAEISVGTRLCFSGRESGAWCGPVTKLGGNGGCFRVETKPGDSGAPVFTEPPTGGPRTVRAVGIVSTGALRPDAPGQTCFTALSAIMASFPCTDCVQFPVHRSGQRAGAPLIRQVDARPVQRRRQGLRIIARLSKRARITVRVRQARSERWHTVRRRAHAGRNVLRIKRLGRAGLRRGRYQIEATARARTQRSTTWQLAVRLR
jgi:hypothetical protein